MRIKKIFVTFAVIVFLSPMLVMAQGTDGTGSALDNITQNLTPVASVYNQPPLSGQDTTAWLIQRVGAVVQVFLSLLGLVMVLLILYGGYLWLTARGNEQQVEDAQHTIRSAIIGALIIIASAAITGFVVGRVGGALLK